MSQHHLPEALVLNKVKSVGHFTMCSWRSAQYRQTCRCNEFKLLLKVNFSYFSRISQCPIFAVLRLLDCFWARILLGIQFSFNLRFSRCRVSQFWTDCHGPQLQPGYLSRPVYRTTSPNTLIPTLGNTVSIPAKLEFPESEVAKKKKKILGSLPHLSGIMRTLQGHLSPFSL